MAVKRLLPATVLFSCSFISRLKVLIKPILSTKKKLNGFVLPTNQQHSKSWLGYSSTVYLEIYKKSDLQFYS